MKRVSLALATRRFQRELRGRIRRCRPQVVIALAHLNPNVCPSLIAARAIGAKCLMMPLLHSEDPGWPFKGVQRALALADGALALTKEEARVLRTDYAVPADRIFVIGVGVVSQLQATTPTAPHPTILFLGRKTEGKGLRLLASALRILAETHENFVVALVGARAEDSDLLASEFSALLKDRFLNLDDVTEEDKAAWLGRCHMLVLPSARESFGTVILEAWTHEKPVIALDLPISREIVQHGVDGLLVPEGDASAMAAAMRQLLDQPEMASELGRAGKRKARDDYSWSTMLDRLEGACQTITAARPMR